LPSHYWSVYAEQDPDFDADGGDFSAVKESFRDRCNMITEIVRYLDLKHNHSIQELTFHSLQDINEPELVQSDRFLRILGRLQSLRLFIATRIVEPFQKHDINAFELHEFASQLSTTWIRPAKSNLTRLALYMDVPWGYAPKVDFRELHLPHLRILELGNWCISHDWQIDWLASHGGTLMTLWMDACSILTKATSTVALDSEGYPLYSIDSPNHPPLPAGIPSERYEYNRRWHHLFDRFAKDLPELSDFRFGISNWFWSDELEDVVEQLPDEHRSPVWGPLSDERYLMFSTAFTDSPWRPRFPSFSDTIQQTEYPPKLLLEDKKSLVRLLRKVGQPIPSYCTNLKT
jgi:hypothetical protein